MEKKENHNQRQSSVTPHMAWYGQTDTPNKARQARYHEEECDVSRINVGALSISPDKASLSASSSPLSPATRHSTSEASNLKFGDYAEQGLQLAPLKLINIYPSLHVAEAWKRKVVVFFRQSMFSIHDWDVFALLDQKRNGYPLLLVPSSQLQSFLKFANTELNSCLVIPQGEAGEEYFLTFGEWGSPRPRFIGRVGSLDELKTIEERCKALGNEDLDQLSAARQQMYRNKVDKIYDSFKSPEARKNAAISRIRRTQRCKGYTRMVKRVQRYLGLRKQGVVDASSPYCSDPSWNVNKLAPYGSVGTVRFVCVDIEAMERNINIVTEIGLAILDTTRIKDVAPGEHGEGWFSKIEAHHFRIDEYSHKVNHRYVKGCPGAFNFGKSVFVPFKQMAQALGQAIGNNLSTDKRPVVMVGHDIKQDLKYLKKVGYNVWRLRHVLDEVDTMSMFQRMERNPNGRRLDAMCDELGTPGYNFHNAGNDAVYTLRAMIAIAVKRTVEGSDFLVDPEVPLAVDEWSDGEADDGGNPEVSSEPLELVKSDKPGTSQDIKW